MFGCKEVIPPKLRDFDWKGTDNDSSFGRIKKRIQYWLAIGPLGEHWYCKTQPVPITFFHKQGKGFPRYESATGNLVSNKPKNNFFLSRIQLWQRWNIAIHAVKMGGITIPVFIFGHIYWKEKDVPTYPTYQSDHGIRKKFVFQFGYKYDGDQWYIPTVFVGGNDE